ncbi:hypothetical protein CDD80_1835 [Ophiocordyceps camponoti-rufipedis]|uniref:Uncharacterized protein n=1 Tax=Ophiocordyceps camponoti-rufipedis TaxID=2004952 RepID=A0A2C5Z2Q0_9HYPO|nr:hypothetical protein CDD80_1835 [Ophiocordyceps camponoti-rufipedis]
MPDSLPEESNSTPIELRIPRHKNTPPASPHTPKISSPLREECFSWDVRPSSGSNGGSPTVSPSKRRWQPSPSLGLGKSLDRREKARKMRAAIQKRHLRRQGQATSQIRKGLENMKRLPTIEEYSSEHLAIDLSDCHLNSTSEASKSLEIDVDESDVGADKQYEFKEQQEQKDSNPSIQK